MIILETGIRLGEEAFVERRFKEGVNILFSDDNNKGKTLIIQGMLYALGNQPIFPTGFNYREATFYTKCRFNEVTWTFLRKDSIIQVHGPNGINVFESISEYKRFFSENISPLPMISMDNERKLADPELFFQMFYLSQDKRNPSNLIGGSYYRKADFLEMVYALGNDTAPFDSKESIQELKDELISLKSELESVKRSIKFSKKHPDVASIALKGADKENFVIKRQELSKVHARISSLTKDRLREENRIAKLERLSNELLSLNRDLAEGKVICGDCGSKNIIYKVGEFLYDVSNSYVRAQILESIKNQIALKKEIIHEKSRDINDQQTILQRLIETTPRTLQQIMAFSQEISSLRNLDEKHISITSRINKINQTLVQLKQNENQGKQGNNLLEEEILSLMNFYYKKIDPDGIQKFTALFTKNDQTYSGSEEQEFYFSKLVALSDVLKHEYPIIIDSFRDGEISSGKENVMIEILLSKKKQSILTATLKQQEYADEKYSKFPSVNSINYSGHINSHILNDEDLKEFSSIYKIFGIS